MNTSSFACVTASVALLAGCETATDEADPATLSSRFTIELLDSGSPSDVGQVDTWRDFDIGGNLYGRVTGSDIEVALTLIDGEKITISDGVHEHALERNYVSGGSLDTEYSFSRDTTHNPTAFLFDAPAYTLRYYRHDGTVLENRIEVPALPRFVAPAVGTHWNPHLEVLAVEWTSSPAPARTLNLYAHCIPLPFLDELGAHAMTFDVQDTLHVDIDLTGRAFTPGCTSRATAFLSF